MAVFTDAGPERVDSPASRRLRNTTRSSDLVRRTATVQATQSLFSGFRNQANLSAARIDERLARLDYRLAVQSALLGASTAYLDVMRQTELARLATENQRIVRSQLGLEDERVTRGSGAAIDALLAKARLQMAGERLVTFEGATKEATARFAQIVGRPPLTGGHVASGAAGRD